jgi:regulatory protein YycI of two-component signal transduction system YycFG
VNWEVAKNWLIVVFLVLDLILGWQVYQSRTELVGYVESYSDILANTKTILAEHGLSLEATPPPQHPDMPFLHAEYAQPNLTDLSQSAFSKGESFSIDSDAGIVRTATGMLRWMAPGIWVTKYDVPPTLPSNNPADFLGRVWQGSNYVYDTSQASNPGFGQSKTTYTYLQKYNNYVVFDSTLNVDVSNGKLLGYDQIALTKLYAAGDAKPTISALDALNSLANSVDKSVQRKDNKILNIALGYIHKNQQNPSSSVPLSAPNYWFPAWRVTTTDLTYYINAFTGEVDSAS